jgi:hypothetical protein
VQAAIYRSVDSEGNVVFTDQPDANAEPLKLPAVPTYSPPPAAARATVKPNAEAEKAAAAYGRFAIESPEQGEALWENSGQVEVRLSLEPPLRNASGHRVLYYLDGKAEGDPVGALSKVFTNLDRGEHTVSATIVDADGQTVSSTGTVRFQLHRQSSLSPQRQNTPNKAPNPKPKP